LCAQCVYFFHQGPDFGFGGGRGAGAEVVRGGIVGLQEFELDGRRVLWACGNDCGSVWEFDAPETGGGLGKFQFDVIASGRIGAFACDLGDDFALGLLVGEEEKLAGRERGGKTNDSAVWEDERGGGGLFEEFALAGVFFGTRAGGDYWRFVDDGTTGMRRT